MSSAQNQPPGDTGTGAQQAPPDDAARQYVPRPSPHYETAPSARPRGAVLGVTMGVAVLMLISGAWNFLEGLAALIRGSFFVVLPHYAYNISVTGWGWFHLILGAIVFAAGCALFTDAAWARVTGVIIASVSALVNFLYIPYQPVWSIAVIIIDLVIIWALVSPRRAYN